MMQPLCVTAHLAAPLAVSRPLDLAFDGILAHTVIGAACGGDFLALPDPREQPVWYRLPLVLQGEPETVARVEMWQDGQIGDRSDYQDALWWYACSSMQYIGPTAEDTHHWNKRFDTKYMDMLDPKVNTIVIEKGRYKAYHQPLMVVSCRAVRWHVNGDKDALEAILSTVWNIGKKRAYGYAEVLRWQIEPEDDDLSLMTTDGGFARPVPVAWLPDGAWREAPMTQHVAYRAPQWLPYNQALCAIGGRV